MKVLPLCLFRFVFFSCECQSIVLTIIIIDAVYNYWWCCCRISSYWTISNVWRNDIAQLFCFAMQLLPSLYSQIVKIELNCVSFVRFFPLDIWHPVSFFKRLRFVTRSKSISFWWSIENSKKKPSSNGSHCTSHLLLFFTSFVLFGKLTKSQDHIVVKRQSFYAQLTWDEMMSTILFFVSYHW